MAKTSILLPVIDKQEIDTCGNPKLENILHWLPLLFSASLQSDPRVSNADLAGMQPEPHKRVGRLSPEIAGAPHPSHWSLQG
ncbi:hypothetical protein RRG08_038929 [Elysia crispata]|uniref:Uncharacterized protein n=1 Tax=Elysia crispata TaxID=231223 RepID=A0AAE1CTG5_9GAST|nr:hypothetical protein RRG08_038929 [Elysia crispata]